MAAKNMKYITLNTGAKMPILAFGTLMDSFVSNHDETVKVVSTALDVGYRHFDCALIYGTEPAVGEAIKQKMADGTVKTREELFLTSKLWRTFAREKDVVPALKKSLKNLGVEYVDLYLIHWPTQYKSGEELIPKDENGKEIYSDIDYLETWRGMEEAYRLGLAKAVGVSNFNSKQLKRLMDNCKVMPAHNQVESHPFFTNTKLIKFCQNLSVTMCAYSPLAGLPDEFRLVQREWKSIYTDETMKKVAAKYNKSPAQIALRFQIQRDVCVNPKSAKRERMEQNMEALNFQLSDEDMQAIEGLDDNMRINDQHPDHPYYPFAEEF